MKRFTNSSVRKNRSGVISLNQDGSAYVVGVECVNDYLRKGYVLLEVGTMTLESSTSLGDYFFYRMRKRNDLLPDFRLEKAPDLIVFKEDISQVKVDTIHEIAEALDNGTQNRFSDKGWIQLHTSVLNGKKTYSFGNTRNRE